VVAFGIPLPQLPAVFQTPVVAPLQMVWARSMIGNPSKHTTKATHAQVLPRTKRQLRVLLCRFMTTEHYGLPIGTFVQ
jgi:hypothetical protein